MFKTRDQTPQPLNIALLVERKKFLQLLCAEMA